MNMVRHQGIPIRVSRCGAGFAADYTAVSHFVNHAGGVAYGATEESAVRAACDKVDELVLHVAMVERYG